MLRTLQQLLEIDATSLHSVLNEATQSVAETMGADKVDAFLLDSAVQTLVATGTSDTPMGHRQHALGLDRLPLANGGRTVEIFETGQPYLHGHVEEDAGELRGIREGLGVRSEVGVPLEVPGGERGVLLACSATPEYFTTADERFLQAVARWVGLVAHRAALVERVAADAEEQGRRRAAEELITVLAHDMGNLLAPLKARIDLITRRLGREDLEKTRTHAIEAGIALERIRRFTRELLDVERLERGLFVLHTQPVDLYGLACEVVQSLGNQGVPLRVDVRAPDPEALVIWADPDRLRQALENVVGNAIKYSEEGVPVSIILNVESRNAEEAGQGQQYGRWATLVVADQGPGVPPELMPHLFNKFSSGPGSSGLGLGLYLASRIAAAHGGTLTVESAPGKGARFRFALPTGQTAMHSARLA